MRAVFLVFLSPLVLLVSCGSLTESECLATNWEQMGVEDGQAGRDTSGFDRYLQGCGEKSVQADAEAYQKGREEGLRAFCQSENGFEVGKTGYQYLGVCPAGLEGPFLAEYNIGIRFYFAYQEISQVELAISSNDDTLEKLARGIDNATFRLYNTQLTVKEQFDLEQNIRSMEDQIQIYEQDSLRLQSLVVDKQKGLEDLKALYRR